MNEPISQLMSDIAAFRNMILYYENRILQKEIAIRELMDSHAVKQEAALSTELSVRDVVVQTLALRNLPEQFGPNELIAACIAAFPGYDADSIRRNLGNTLRDNLVPEGIVERLGHGVYQMCK